MRWPVVGLIIAAGLFTAALGLTAAGLPERVASHFGFSGAPNDYMTRATYLLVMIGAGIGITLLMLAIALLVHKMPPSLMNFPNKHYWLSEERRAATQHYLGTHCLWLPAIMLVFLAALHLIVVQANHQTPARLSNALVFGLAACVLLAVLCWARTLMRHFSLPPA